MITEIIHQSLRNLYKFIFHHHQPTTPSYPTPYFINPITMERTSLESLGFSEADLDQVSDTFTCQQPLPVSKSSLNKPRVLQSPRHVTLSPPDIQQDSVDFHLKKLKTIWIDQEDPLHPTIIDLLKIICEINEDERKDLLHRYKHMVKISGDDLPQLLYTLTETHVDGYSALLSSIKMGITAYSSAISRNAKTALADIAVSAADIQSVAQNVLEQYSTFQETPEHLALSWNNTSQSMASYMEEIDKKNLRSSQPGPSSKRTTTSPSTHSTHSLDSRIGVQLKLLPGRRYTSEWGILSMDLDENVGFSALSSSGSYIAKLIDVLRKPKVLEMILDRDITKIINFLKENHEVIQEYKVGSQEQKRKILKDIGSAAPTKLGQWVLYN